MTPRNDNPLKKIYSEPTHRGKGGQDDVPEQGKIELKEKKLITPNEPLFDEVKGGDPPRCSKVGGVSIEPRGMYDGLDKKSQKMGGNVKPPKKVRFKLEEGNPSSNSNIKHGSKEMECDRLEQSKLTETPATPTKKPQKQQQMDKSGTDRGVAPPPPPPPDMVSFTTLFEKMRICQKKPLKIWQNYKRTYLDKIDKNLFLWVPDLLTNKQTSLTKWLCNGKRKNTPHLLSPGRRPKKGPKYASKNCSIACDPPKNQINPIKPKHEENISFREVQDEQTRVIELDCNMEAKKQEVSSSESDQGTAHSTPQPKRGGGGEGGSK